MQVTGAEHHHRPQSLYDICTGILFFQFLFKDPVYHERYVTGQEVGLYPVFLLQVYRPCPELCLHDPEAFLDLPPLFVDPDDFRDALVLEVRTDGIEPVVLFFFTDQVFIKKNIFFRAGFAVLGHRVFPYEAVRVVLVLRALFISSALYQFVRPVDLPGEGRSGSSGAVYIVRSLSVRSPCRSAPAGSSSDYCL